jgi:hypothetical protein
MTDAAPTDQQTSEGRRRDNVAFVVIAGALVSLVLVAALCVLMIVFDVQPGGGFGGPIGG